MSPPALSSRSTPRAARSVADAVGGGEVAAPAGGVPLFDQPLDLLDRHRRLLVFGAPQAQDAEHAVELVERLA